MKYLPLLLKIILNLKIELVLVILFSFAVIFYCSNPYVINPAEFTLYTKYLIPFGTIVWLLASFRLHLSISQSFPLNWLSVNELVHRPIMILINQISVAFLCFLTVQLVIGGIIASTIVIIFSSGFDLYNFIFRLYLIYFTLPFIWSWIIGLAISIVYTFYSSRKGFLIFSIFVVWLVTIFILEYAKVTSIFIENRWPYVDQIHNLTFLEKNVILKFIYLITSFLILVIFIKFKRPVFGFALNILFITLVTLGIYSIQSHGQIHEVLQANDYKLYNQIKDKTDENIETTNNWRITSVKVDVTSQYPIEIEMALNEKEELVRFSINDQFSIADIKSNGKNLDFKQKGRIVEVEVYGAQSMVLYYDKTFGTSFYPLMSNAIFLPFESNWYPHSTNSNHYILDSLGNLHFNIETRSCEKIEIVIGKNNYNWHGDNLDCLSIIKGAYKQLNIQDTEFIVYKPYLTKRKSYLEIKEYLQLVNSELCRLFNQIIHNEYCSVNEIQSIIIIPKSLNTPNLSLYDSTVSNGYYTFYVNPFLDVNIKPVTDHIKELSTFLIPYRVLNNEQLSLFVSQYLIEKFNIEPIGYLEWIVNDFDITLADWDQYTSLTLEEKENFLIQMAIELD